MIFRTAERGVTLLELSVVAVILGLMAALIWPEIRRYARVTWARAEADDVRVRLREARAKALLNRREVVVDFGFLREHTTSSNVVRFYADGSADPVEITPKARQAVSAEIALDPSGRIRTVSLHEKN